MTICSSTVYSNSSYFCNLLTKEKGEKESSKFNKIKMSYVLAAGKVGVNNNNKKGVSVIQNCKEC